MAKEATYSGMLGDWRRLLTVLLANILELAHLEPFRIKLEALLARATEIIGRQADEKARKQESSRQLKEVMKEGQRLATLLRQSVKEHYGPTSEKLTALGVQPFRGRNFTAKKSPEPAPAAGSQS